MWFFFCFLFCFCFCFLFLFFCFWFCFVFLFLFFFSEKEAPISDFLYSLLLLLFLFFSSGIKLKVCTYQIFPLIFCFLCYTFRIMEGYAKLTIYDLLRALCVCTHHNACNTTNAICNPWTASKSDCATKIIVTLSISDGFQKILKNSVKADEVFYGKQYYLCHIM